MKTSSMEGWLRRFCDKSGVKHMKNRALFVLVPGLLLCATSSFGQLFRYSSINAPNSTATCAGGVGPGGQIVGGYMGAADGKEHGYLYANGTFTTIDVPGSLAGLPDDVKLETEVNGINPAGDMVGDYFATPGAPGAPACINAFSPPCQRGFLYRRGQFYSILATDHQGVTHLGSVPSSITPDGSIYGCLHDQTFGRLMFGFVRAHSNVKTLQAGGGEFRTLQAGGGELADTAESHPNSMNNAATPDGSIIVGLYTPPGASRAHGFTVQNGIFADYVFPGSTATQNWGINPDGNFVGTYRDTSGLFHGFLQLADGSAPIPMNFMDPVTGIVAIQSHSLGINPAGLIVGFYLDAGGEHGFLAMQISATD